MKQIILFSLVIISSCLLSSCSRLSQRQPLSPPIPESETDLIDDLNQLPDLNLDSDIQNLEIELLQPEK